MTRSTFRISAALAGAALALSACGVTGSDSGTPADGGGSTGSAEAQPLTDKRIMVPNSAGGGYDQTARTAAQVMEETGISSGLEVFNLEGAQRGDECGDRLRRMAVGARRALQDQ